jgi:fumarylacetoacetase
MNQFKPRIDETHDPGLSSWVESANDPATDFPIQNLPIGMIIDPMHGHPHYVTLIGDQMVDVSMLVEGGAIGRESGEEVLGDALEFPSLMGVLGSSRARRAWRVALQRFLRADRHAGQSVRRLREKAVRPVAQGHLHMPFLPGNYTDFYASIHHATTVGSMFRPENPLLPNYKWVPIAYHGRASTIVVSGTDVHRPCGQTRSDDAPAPTFGPSRMLDYELEVGCVIGVDPEGRSEATTIDNARSLIAGICLVNDWSARDIQKWEYQPLGPFLSKNFATSVSPVVVTVEALEPFRCAPSRRPDGDPCPLDYLRNPEDEALGAYDLTLEVWLQSAEMERRGLSPVRLSRSRAFRDLYWTFAQMIAHHTSNGCRLETGDLLASGTVSGPGADERGCLLELTWDGSGKPRKPVELPTGERRLFLEDGDTVILRGFAERDGFRRIGLGECRGRILPARGSARMLSP